MFPCFLVADCASFPNSKTPFSGHSLHLLVRYEYLWPTSRPSTYTKCPWSSSHVTSRWTHLPTNESLEILVVRYERCPMLIVNFICFFLLCERRSRRLGKRFDC